MDALEILYLVVVPMILVMAVGSLIARVLVGGRTAAAGNRTSVATAPTPTPTLDDLAAEIETPRREGCCGSCGGVRH